MDLKSFQEQVFFSTVRITTSLNSGEGDSIGTGFIFHAPLNDDQNSYITLLISNKHVYGDPKNSINLNFHRRSPQTPERPLLGETKSLGANDFSEIYVAHPDPEVDLACLIVNRISKINEEIFYKNLQPSMIASFQEHDLLPGNDIWFVGYPENRYDVHNNLPILRKGHIASIPKIDFNNRKNFIIDAHVLKGSSGSPVFTDLGSQYKFIGVITKTMIKHQQLQADPADSSTNSVEQFLGLGVVLKAELVRDLISFAVDKFKKSGQTSP